MLKSHKRDRHFPSLNPKRDRTKLTPYRATYATTSHSSRVFKQLSFKATFVLLPSQNDVSFAAWSLCMMLKLDAPVRMLINNGLPHKLSHLITCMRRCDEVRTGCLSVENEPKTFT